METELSGFEGLEVSLPPLDVAPGEVPPGTGKATLSLSEDEKDDLAKSLLKLLQSHDSSMAPKLKRWRSIEEAYSLVPDSDRQGQKPDASRLVSELTRSSINLATAQLDEALIGTSESLVIVQVSDDQDESEETTEAVELAEKINAFLDSYTKAELDLETNLYFSIHQACKLGGARVRLMWEVEKRNYTYRGEDGKIVREEENVGKVAWTHIPNRLTISYPLSENDLQKTIICGQRNYMEHFEFRALCASLKIPKEKCDELLSEADERDEGLDEGQKDKDIATGSENALDGQICVIELWCNMPLPGEVESSKFQVFFLEDKRKVIWCDHNPLMYQRVPYFEIPYWVELESIHGSGVGHESLYPQAADSAMWNMYIDNLKIVGNFLRIFKAGSTAEAMRDEIGPGRDLVTEDPEGDFVSMQIGGDLSPIHEGMDRNDNRHMRGTGINAPMQGMADPVLKSGASPGSYMQLIGQANKKFKKIDLNVRGRISRMYMFILELLQQFAPEGVYYQHTSDETARVVSRIRFTTPRGDLQKRFRIMVQPPSAASNRESLRTNIMLIHNLTLQAVPLVIQLADATYGATDPAKAQQFKEKQLIYLQDIHKEVIQIHDIPGLSAKVPSIKETPADVLINQLYQKLAEQSQVLEQMQGALDAGSGTAGPQLAAAGGQR